MGLIDELESMDVEQKNSFEILEKLLQSKEIELKSHVVAPLELSILKALGELLKNNGMVKSATTINSFINYYLKVMVSWDRMSRSEIIKAIAQIQTETPTKSLAKALTSRD